jgi:hypothetical protein
MSHDNYAVNVVAIKYSNIVYIHAEAVIKVPPFLNFLYFNNSEYKLSTSEYHVLKQKKASQ